MKKFSQLTFIKKCPLFNGLEDAELAAILSCLDAEEKKFPKDAAIFNVGEPLRRIGMMLVGSAHIVRDDFWGKREILANLTPGELFGEALACAGVERFPVSVVAMEASEVLLFDYKKITEVCPEACSFHSLLLGNMLRILARKNVSLVRKMEHLTRRSTREKLLSYLSSQARQAGKNSFSIPFNRQELADYLSVDRSAMSAELSKMRDEGILNFTRNEFELFRIRE